MYIDSVIDCVLAGDRDRYAEVIKKYQEDVWMVVALLIHDYTLIDDVVQGTFLKAFYALKSYRLGTDFGAWLRTIARNEARKALRTVIKESKASGNYVEEIAARMAVNDADDIARRKSYLEECLGKLSERSRGVVELKYEMGKPIAGIAESMNTSKQAIHMVLSRIRGALRSCIERMERQSETGV